MKLSDITKGVNPFTGSSVNLLSIQGLLSLTVGAVILFFVFGLAGSAYGRLVSFLPDPVRGWVGDRGGIPVRTGLRGQLMQQQEVQQPQKVIHPAFAGFRMRGV